MEMKTEVSEFYRDYRENLSTFSGPTVHTGRSIIKAKAAADSVIAGHSKHVAKKALPMAELVGDIKDQLDKTFAEHHGVAPVIRAQQWATNFRVFNMNFKDRAPIFDDDLGTIAARSSSSTVLVQDKY